MKNEKNPLVQGGIDSTFVFFLRLWEKLSRYGGAGLRPAQARDALVSHSLKFFLANAEKKCTVYTSLNKWILFVFHCFEQTFINVSNWKLPLHLSFSHLPIFKCWRRPHCEKFGAAAFLILVWKFLDKRQLANDLFVFELKTNQNQIYRVYTENRDFNGYKVRFWRKKKLYGKNIIVIE